MKQFQLGKLTINPGLVLAPMSGVTNSAFRRLIKELNPGAVGYVISEFLSVEGMTRGSQRTRDMMRFRPEERPFGIQIFGYDVDRMRDAALMAQDSGADVVDINCGCPAPKVVRRGGGAELMRQPEHLEQIVKACRKGVTVPLTLKMRSGWDESSRNCVEIAKMCESEGIDMLTVHGRTRAQLYRGFADWGYVRAVTEAVKMPVCGSGDVVDQRTAFERMHAGGAAGVYIGRAAIGNPIVFSQIVKPQENAGLTSPRCAQILLRYRELLLEDMPARAAVGRLKQMCSQMKPTAEGVGGGNRWRKAILRAMSDEAVFGILTAAALGDEAGWRALDSSGIEGVGDAARGDGEVGPASDDLTSTDVSCIDSCEAFTR